MAVATVAYGLLAIRLERSRAIAPRASLIAIVALADFAAALAAHTAVVSLILAIPSLLAAILIIWHFGSTLLRARQPR